jgi:hypothetical protein
MYDISKEKNKEKQKMENKIKREELLEELKIAIEDIFVAGITKTEGQIRLQFLNGQQFLLTIEEE